MPQFLLELLSEDVPARMQAPAARDLERLARESLARAELAFDNLRAHAGPRRLTLVVEGLPGTQSDRREERRGPRLDAAEAAIDGFARSAGVAREDLVARDGAWFAHILRQGRPTADILAEVSAGFLATFPWPKSMTSGGGRMRWVRPLRRILCVFDRRVVPLEIEGLAASDLSEGHRFMGSRRPFRARDFDEYREALAGHFVVLERAERKRRIDRDSRALCAAEGLELLEDEGLLEELAGMAEWPVPLLGRMDPAFLDLPPEVIRTSMRAHQRYFAVRTSEGALAPRFIAVANIEARDGGALIAAGAARVLAARLGDARFFWDEDRKVRLEDRLRKLEGVVFHARIGTMGARAARLEALARQIAPFVGADGDLAARAGRLAKADLVSGMVGEFPELQGVMGGYYAASEGLSPEIAAAIRDHYQPQGPGDQVPSAPVTLAVALADKLDALVQFFAINERPTGSRDPFGLRRAALGVIRIVLANRLRLPLRQFTGDSAALMEFFAERLKVLLRDEGRRHDVVDGIFALGDDDLVRVVARLDALAAFLETEDGANLLAGYRRATNILNAEAKKGPLPEEPPVRVAGAPAQEADLLDALGRVDLAVREALVRENYGEAMTALASLRTPVDAFFDKVLVNSPDPVERTNRLRLLASVRRTMSEIADFSRIAT